MSFIIFAIPVFYCRFEIYHLTRLFATCVRVEEPDQRTFDQRTNRPTDQPTNWPTSQPNILLSTPTYVSTLYCCDVSSVQKKSQQTNTYEFCPNNVSGNRVKRWTLIIKINIRTLLKTISAVQCIIKVLEENFGMEYNVNKRWEHGTACFNFSQHMKARYSSCSLFFRRKCIWA